MDLHKVEIIRGYGECNVVKGPRKNGRMKRRMRRQVKKAARRLAKDND